MRNNPPPDNPPLAYRVDDFCRLIGICRTNVYGLMKAGQLRTVLIGGRRLIPASEAGRLQSASSEGTAA